MDTKTIILIAFIVAVGIIVSVGLENASAMSTQQYNKIFWTPFYQATFTHDVLYNYEINLNPPDEISSVITAIVTVDLYINPTLLLNYTLKVNNQTCNTPSFIINPNFASQGETLLRFDCKNIINKKGIYNISLIQTGNVNAGSVTGWLEITYMNNPLSLLSAGTEYSPNEAGRVFARLLDGNSDPINLGNCNTTIYYPNNTKFINNQQMVFLEKGFYYYDFTTPSIIGNYIVGFDCIFPASIMSQNRTYFGYSVTASNPSFTDSFLFDDSNNITINNAWIYFSVTGSGAGASNDFYFNGNYLGTATGITETLNSTLSQGKFSILEGQQFSIYRNALSSNINFVIFYVNYTYNSPMQVIRGQNEIHIGNISSNINSNILNISEKITSVNNTVKNESSAIQSNQQTIYNYLVAHNSSVFGKLTAIQNDVTNSYNNLTNLVVSVNNSILATNSSIFNKLYLIQDDLVSINDTIKSMNTTNDLIEIKNKLQSIQNDISYVNNTVIDARNNLSSSIYATNSSIFGKLYSIQGDLSDISILISGTNSSIMSKLFSIQDEIANVNATQNSNFAELNANMGNNFTNTNNLIANINNTITSWLSSLNSTINLWGNSLTSAINYWGNALENKIDSIIMGNVTVTALVDYDEIASTVVQYFKGLGFKFPLIG